MRVADDQIVHEIRRIIRDYHYALDRREHGDIAKYHAIQAIEAALRMPWVQGEEAARRARSVKHDAAIYPAIKVSEVEHYGPPEPSCYDDGETWCSGQRPGRSD